jgi:hypothetical protein
MFNIDVHIDSPRQLVQFWQNFQLQTSLVLLIPNCTRHRMITYTISGVYFYYIKQVDKILPLSVQL